MVYGAGVDPFGWPCVCHRRSTLPSSSVAHLREVFGSSVAWQSRQVITVDSKCWNVGIDCYSLCLLVEDDDDDDDSGDDGGTCWATPIGATRYTPKNCLHGSCDITCGDKQMDHTPDIPTEVTQISSDFIYKGLWHQDVNVSWSIEVRDQNQAKNLRWVWVVIIWFAALAIPHISLSCPFPTSTVAITVKKIHVEICGILVTVNVGSAQKTPCPSMMGRPYRCARQIPRRRAKPTPDSRHSTQFLKSMC